MAITVNVNGVPIQYPQTGDPNWGENATNFAIQTSAALGKIGLSSGTSVDIPQTLTVNGSTTLGDTSGDSLTINSNGVSIPNGLNFDSNTFVIDATNNRVGIGISSPANRLTIGGETAQYPTSVAIAETSHASSKRAGILIGSWLQMQDSNGNGTRDLSFYYTQGTPYTAFNIGTNGQLSAVIPGGTTLYPGYLCRAWVNFNGTGTVAIRSSGNVSSITDNGTGDYTINFTTAMPDTSYAAISSTSGTGTIGNNPSGNRWANVSVLSTSQLKILARNELNVAEDANQLFIGIFR